MLRLLTVLFILLLPVPAAPAAAANARFLEAVITYDHGQYDTALRAFRRLARRGHDGAEFMLGAMYFYGKGVPRNDRFAAIWFHKAAIQGHPGSQLAFGSLHIRGIGVQQNLAEAYKWLTIAADRGVPGLRQQAILLRDEAARLMQPDEIAAAERAAHRFTPTRAGLVTESALANE
ncbi:MAG TPA: tetratricopeptide repeat protein [Alphaproteobacteria bacterium]|nr:tetratricopeptide repeat protein [Alphaproteobacteria bacterium]